MTDTVPTPLVSEGWNLLSNRSAVLQLAASSYTLRPPRIGELEQLADLYDGFLEQQAAHLAEMDRRNSELAQQVEAGKVSAVDAAKQIRALRRELDRFLRAGWWGVLRSMFEMLCDKPLPPDEELPGWLAASAGQQLGELFSHFRSPPRRPGPSETQAE